MNPTSSFTFTSCPTQCTFVDSQAYMQRSTNQTNVLRGNFGQSTDQAPLPTPSTIHINPRMCTQRSIYINRALYSSQNNEPVANLPPKKVDRVYYNPKFFGNPTFTNTVPSSLHPTSLPCKQESKIHVNPNFFRKKINPSACKRLTETIPTFQEGCTYEKPPISTAIHINPMFLKDIRPECSARTVNPVINVNKSDEYVSNSSTSTPRQKYVSKYKIVQKKVSPALISDASVFKKTNLKKINQTPLRKGKFKIVKGKCLKYVSQGVANQKYSFINKYSLKRTSSRSKIVNSASKNYSSSLRNTPKYRNTVLNKTKTNFLLNKKSILQQKIEARRKVKSSLNLSLSYNSKYKYVRSPQYTQKPSRPSLKHFQNKYFYKRNSFNETLKSSSRFSTEFKSLGRMKLVRKSVLQKQIESRMRARKVPSNTNVSPRVLSQKKIADKVSKYKIIRSLNETPAKKPSSNKTTSTNKSVIKKKRSSLKFSSDKYRSEKLKKVAILTKKLRKNNQPCPFYHRFGRCKGKDRGTCPKLHDPKYIGICKRFIKGDCNDEKCLLSHDIRPEKMPTCHHYLAGLCKRTDCPYLHIKVNPKAPICRSFLQGFCADVFNCTKRHEFICPTFVEKGSCPRGKSCSLPHRTATTKSKLLEPDQFPLLSRKRKQKPREKKVSTTNENISLDSCPTDGGQQSIETTEENKPKEFKRYFLAEPPVDDDPSESSDDSSDE